MISTLKHARTGNANDGRGGCRDGELRALADLLRYARAQSDALGTPLLSTLLKAALLEIGDELESRADSAGAGAAPPEPVPFPAPRARPGKRSGRRSAQ